MTPEKLDEYLDVLRSHGETLFWGVIIFLIFMVGIGQVLGC